MSEINAGVGIGPGGALVIQGANGYQANVDSSGNLFVNVAAGNSATAANQTNGAQLTQIFGGTPEFISADVVKGDSGFNGVATAGGTKTITFTTSSNGAQIFGPYSCEGFSRVEVVLTSNGTGLALTGQFCPTSGGSYSTPSSWGAGSGQETGALGTTLLAVYHSPVLGNYFQINVSALTSGTVTGTITFRNAPTMQSSGLSVTQSGTWTVGSNSATGSAVPANAFMIGGVDNSGNLQNLRLADTGDGVTTKILDVQPMMYNNTNDDRQRNNTTGAVIAAGATTAQTSSTITTYNASKLAVVINISAFTSGTLTFTVNGITSSGYIYPILVSTALGATGTTPLRIFPGATPSANAVANDMVPRSFNVVVTGTFSATYGVDYELSV